MTQDVLYHFVKQLNSELIGPILVFVLLGAGVFFTFRLKFIPRYYLRALRDIFKSSKGGEKATVHSGMSPLQALSTAEPTLKSKACSKCLYFTKIISD